MSRLMDMYSSISYGNFWEGSWNFFFFGGGGSFLPSPPPPPPPQTLTTNPSLPSSAQRREFQPWLRPGCEDWRFNWNPMENLEGHYTKWFHKLESPLHMYTCRSVILISSYQQLQLLVKSLFVYIFKWAWFNIQKGCG